ncbi:hypothetical protein LJB81_03225 [Desulfovibrio sp. OttesenSCG-928-M14]|nr:hypothetical protein [Desulfovibrio sp. OttesenSCG-928-M14]
MLAFFFRPRKIFDCTKPFTPLLNTVQQGNLVSAVLRLVFIGVVIFACLSQVTPVQAEIVMQSGGRSLRLHDDGSFSNEAVEASSPKMDGQPWSNGTSMSVPAKKQETAPPEALPYGIVPEVHVPYVPDGGRVRPPRPGPDGQIPEPPPRPGQDQWKPGNPPRPVDPGPRP